MLCFIVLRGNGLQIYPPVAGPCLTDRPPDLFVNKAFPVYRSSRGASTKKTPDRHRAFLRSALLDDFRHQMLPTESEGFCFGLHIDIEMIAFDGTAAILATELADTLDADLGTEREGRGTGESTLFRDFQPGSGDTIALAALIGRRRIGRSVDGELLLRQNVPQTSLLLFPAIEDLVFERQGGLGCRLLIFNRKGPGQEEWVIFEVILGHQRKFRLDFHSLHRVHIGKDRY